jgi:hypothetical protein
VHLLADLLHGGFYVLASDAALLDVALESHEGLLDRRRCRNLKDEELVPQQVDGQLISRLHPESVTELLRDDKLAL